MEKEKINSCIKRFLKKLSNEGIDITNLDIDKIIRMYKLYEKINEDK